MLLPPKASTPSPGAMIALPSAPLACTAPPPALLVLVTESTLTLQHGNEPVRLSGTATASGEPPAPVPVKVVSCEIEDKPLTAAVVWSEPSGNFNPPSTVSIVPITVSLDAGVAVPTPMLPSLVSVIVESPSTDLLAVNPVHLDNCPSVPLPVTGN